MFFFYFRSKKGGGGPGQSEKSLSEDTQIFLTIFDHWRRGWQNFEEKNWRGVSRDSFFLKILSPLEPILRAKIENMISPDYVLCYIPRAMAILS